MAAIATIFGGLVGYILAMLAYFVAGTGLMAALAVWTIGGVGFVGAAIVIGRLSRVGNRLPAQA
jgi:hypothetical protein